MALPRDDHRHRGLELLLVPPTPHSLSFHIQITAAAAAAGPDGHKKVPVTVCASPTPLLPSLLPSAVTECARQFARPSEERPKGREAKAPRSNGKVNIQSTALMCTALSYNVKTRLRDPASWLTLALQVTSLNLVFTVLLSTVDSVLR